VTVGDTVLAPTAGSAPGTAFTVGAAGGTLSYHLADGSRWWAWTQLAGLLVLTVLAAPAVRRRDEPSGPRHMAGEEPA